MPKKRTMTAGELVARLNADPEYVAAMKAQDERLKRETEELKRAEAPLVQELRAAGLDVESAWDLVNTEVTTPEYLRALPILHAHLLRPYPELIREGIARALAVPEAKFAWRDLVECFRREPDNLTAKQGLAVALGNVADDETLEELIALAQDPSHGDSRGLLLIGLGRSRQPRSVEALEEFTSDPLLQYEAQRLLRRKKPRKRRGKNQGA